MKILALDLGNFKSVACEFTTEASAVRYETLVSSKAAVAELVERVQPDRVVLEICPLAGWVSDEVRRQGVELEVAGTNERRSRWRQVKRKSDRKDALKLAQRSALQELKLVHVPEPEIRQWRSLISYRRRLVKRRTAIKNNIRGLLLRENLSWARGKSGWTQEAVAKLEALSKPLAEVGSMRELWRGELTLELEALKGLNQLLGQVEKKLDQIGAASAEVKLLRSIPGVGPRLAEALVAQFDDPGRLQNSKEVGPYLGLVPKQWQSGETERLGHITRQGSSLVRALLVEASWTGLRYNPALRELFQRVRRGRKDRRKIAIVAVARHLAVYCWAMLRDGTQWHEPAVVLPGKAVE